MSNMTREQFLERITAGCLASLLPFRSEARDVPAPAVGGPLLIPYPAKPWAQSTRLVGDRPQQSLAALEGKSPSFDRLPLYNDFCLASDAAGRWHCIGILFEGSNAEDFRQDKLFHRVAESVQGPYRSIEYVDLGYGKQSGVWAPYIWRDKHRALIFYAYFGGDGASMSIRGAQASDPQLRSWRRGVAGKEVLFSESADRDPQIIRDRRTGLYSLYYVTSIGTNAEAQNVVRLRTSHDLLSWSEPRTVLGTPPGYKAAESVFVLQENGYYYMWVSGFDYALMSLYISTDPTNFGDAADNRMEEQSGHAPEIVHADGRYWMACVAIASVPGLPNGKDLPIAQHDLEGVYLQPKEWRAATPEMLAKVVGARDQRPHH
ncbi:MAG: hypothetical protein HY508_05395 [Acidobacteria bacterium]|nr:hypothetical protein [Acidobacteriota bacterium]